ncbi:ABC transporter permease, partial [Akkermansia muciniphila]|uniref:ABC transporter permease n=1 Tax=Akkermansia muciniphila TaxID=239935 RepID=UPI00122EF762
MKKKYIIKRLLIAIPTFLGITILVYILSSFASGSPLDMLLQNPYITPEEIERKRIEFGLDQPVIIQYFNWLKMLFQGNLGFSYRANLPVLDMILERLGPTLLLTFTATIFSVLIAVPLGIMSAYKPYSLWDYASSGLSFIGSATPNFFAGMILIYLFAVQLKILPIGGMYDSSGIRSFPILLKHLIMPALVLSLQQVGRLIRQTRGSMLEVLSEDYIRTARAKGLKERTVLIKHGMRTALIPVITELGMMIPFLIGGAVVTEQIFG